MNTEMYEFIEENEEKHWWFRARQNIIRMFITQYREHYNTVLDIGCGSGHFLWGIKDISTNRFGIDEHDYNTAWHTVIQGDARNLPFEDARMDLVTMLDVLEHIPESDKALREIYRVIKPDGLCVLTVPAFQFLYSPYDKNNNHVKRYCKGDLCSKLERNGFQILRCSYFNTWLFPLEAPVRLLEKAIGREVSTSAGGGGNSIVNGMLYRIFNSEVNVLRGHDLPYGLSLIAVVKPKTI